LKKKLVVCVALLVVVFIGASVVYGQEAIKLIVNGKEVKSDVPAQIIDGRTMVPVRFVAEELGSDVEWEADNNSVVITQKLIKVNGEQTTWPYWEENGHLYLEYRNAIELLRMCHNPMRTSIYFSKSTNILVYDNAMIEVPCITKGDFTAISIDYLEYNRGLIKFDWDPAARDLTLLPFN
jgi:hypothetical protein